MSHWEELVVEAVGKVIEFWGFKRNHGRVWALLYLRASSLTAHELEEILALSKGGVSMLLRDLEQWSVVRKERAPGEAAWRYTAETRLFELVRQVVAQREMRFISEIRVELAKANAAAIAAKTSAEELRRLNRLRQLAAATEHTLRLFLRTSRIDAGRAFAIFRGTSVGAARRPQSRKLKRSPHGQTLRDGHGGKSQGQRDSSAVLRVLDHPRP